MRTLNIIMGVVNILLAFGLIMLMIFCQSEFTIVSTMVGTMVAILVTTLGVCLLKDGGEK